MVQGIAFLSKKSWHTKNLANQEKVWIAEQRKAAEETKTKELARQIQLEREREELDRMAGKKTHLDRGIDWMYQGQAATGDSQPSELEKQDAEKQREEFLLGKEYTAEGQAQGDFAAALESKDGVNAVVKLEDSSDAAAAAAAAAAASAYGPGEASVADRNEAFRQRVEDPMFMVSQREREKRTEADKQRALYERVVGPTGNYKDDRDYDTDEGSRNKKKKSSRKRERKQKRKREKEDRKRRRREDEDRYSIKKHRRRDYSDDESSERRHRRKRDRHSSSDEDSESDRGRRSSHHHHSSSRRRRDEGDRRSHGRRRSRSPSSSPDRSARQRHRSSGHHDHHRSDRYRDDYKRTEDHRRRDYPRGEEPRHHGHATDGPTKKVGYGLQGKAASSTSNTLSPKDLGPAQDLLKKRRETAEEERRRAKERAGSRRTMTSEERAQALQEMQAAAKARQGRDNRRRGLEDEEAIPNNGKATFIKDMTQQAHGIKGDPHSLQSRMQQNRNTQQRLHDERFL